MKKFAKKISRVQELQSACPLLTLGRKKLELLEQGVGYTWGTMPPGRSCTEESVVNT